MRRHYVEVRRGKAGYVSECNDTYVALGGGLVAIVRCGCGCWRGESGVVKSRGCDGLFWRGLVGLIIGWWKTHSVLPSYSLRDSFRV